MQSSQLMKLFEDELKDLYWAEKAITKAVTLLKATLKEEKAANEKLSEAAINAINLKAAQVKA